MTPSAVSNSVSTTIVCSRYRRRVARTSPHGESDQAPFSSLPTRPAKQAGELNLAAGRASQLSRCVRPALLSACRRSARNLRWEAPLVRRQAEGDARKTRGAAAPFHANLGTMCRSTRNAFAEAAEVLLSHAETGRRGRYRPPPERIASGATLLPLRPCGSATS